MPWCVSYRRIGQKMIVIIFDKEGIEYDRFEGIDRKDAWNQRSADVQFFAKRRNALDEFNEIKEVCQKLSQL